jgi:hypothetical protein
MDIYSTLRLYVYVLMKAQMWTDVRQMIVTCAHRCCVRVRLPFLLAGAAIVFAIFRLKRGATFSLLGTPANTLSHFGSSIEY